MATVIVVSQKLNKASRVLNFEGTTFGELLATQTQDGINVNDLYSQEEVEVIVNPGNVILRGVDSVLPQGDLKVFFTVKKNKAGFDDFEYQATNLRDELQEEVDEFLEYQISEIVEAGRQAMLAKIAELKGATKTVLNTDQELINAVKELNRL